jgi:hypothetical protein
MAVKLLGRFEIITMPSRLGGILQQASIQSKLPSTEDLGNQFSHQHKILHKEQQYDQL